MLLFSRRKRINDYVNKVSAYITEKQKETSSQIQYSLRETYVEDIYDADNVSKIMKQTSSSTSVSSILAELKKNQNQTFVDCLLYYIDSKNLKGSDVYKAAQIDKRLFSKIVLDHQYKPSKDTAIALAFALKLSLGEAENLLSRAGYTLSHSSTRDIIIEYFFREKIYDIIDINEVLYRLNQKMIGRV